MRDTDRDLTRDEIRDRVTWLKAEARKGANQLHARATANDARAPKLTDAESAAIARKKIDQEETR